MTFDFQHLLVSLSFTSLRLAFRFQTFHQRSIWNRPWSTIGHLNLYPEVPLALTSNLFDDLELATRRLFWCLPFVGLIFHSREMAFAFSGLLLLAVNCFFHFEYKNIWRHGVRITRLVSRLRVSMLWFPTSLSSWMVCFSIDCTQDSIQYAYWLNDLVSTVLPKISLFASWVLGPNFKLRPDCASFSVFMVEYEKESIIPACRLNESPLVWPSQRLLQFRH